MSAAKRTATAPALLTTAQAATYLNFPEKTVKDWRRRNVGPPYIRVNGAQVRYRVRDLDAWLDAQTVGAA